jgi:acetyl-CoA C-acetyltransferase
MPARLDPRLPVVVGVGQVSQRTDRGEPVLEPVALMAEALRRASDDTGARTGDPLAGADSIRVSCELSWRYRDPGGLVADLVGATPADTALTVMGGNYVQTVVNQTARDIQSGANDLVLLTGGEAWRTRTAARRNDTDLAWTTQPDSVPPARQIGGDEPLGHPTEYARGIVMPVHVYPMFDIALRAADGLTHEEHRTRISTLWSTFSDVAADNPNAWIQRRFTPEEIAEPTADNRMIGFPYTKLMNSNNMVEQGAALILCSVERAQSLGIPRDRWVFLHAGADAHDHWYVSNRADLHSSPAIRLAGRAALDGARVDVDDLAYIDLYSCFPSAVQIAARELGLGLERTLTVTGGMSFAGGPWNNYVMHSIATMAGRLRDDEGAYGLCSGNGGYVTKHAFGVYATQPPEAGRFVHAEPQAAIDELPSRALAEDHVGPVKIETYTVMHDRENQPERGLVACLTDDGRRTWGATVDGPTMKTLMADELVGHGATLTADGTVEIA